MQLSRFSAITSPGPCPTDQLGSCTYLPEEYYTFPTTTTRPTCIGRGLAHKITCCHVWRHLKASAKLDGPDFGITCYILFFTSTWTHNTSCQSSNHAPIQRFSSSLNPGPIGPQLHKAISQNSIPPESSTVQDVNGLPEHVQYRQLAY